MKALDNVESLLNDALYDLNRAMSEVDDMKMELGKYQLIEEKLEEEISLLEQELDEMKEENRMLKIDLLEAKNLIDSVQKNDLHCMISSPDRENFTVADQIIDNLYNQNKQ